MMALRIPAALLLLTAPARAADSVKIGFVTTLLRFADRHFILEKGRTVWSGISAELVAAVELQHRYLGA